MFGVLAFMLGGHVLAAVLAAIHALVLGGLVHPHMHMHVVLHLRAGPEPA